MGNAEINTTGKFVHILVEGNVYSNRLLLLQLVGPNFICLHVRVHTLDYKHSAEILQQVNLKVLSGVVVVSMVRKHCCKTN